jgi:hypothetical protein
VEGARSRIGERLGVIVTGALQNPTGRIVFARTEAKPDSRPDTATPPRREAQGESGQPGKRRSRPPR